ncbi:zinc ABC transporter substrate-binding protein ZnuA [Pseudomonas matsuisoli]|uniref:High-affinity zinc uptake system protein ZnuA n=1 Tax=Pseudomonas matsuisoli TaxID=1515666 RepID=A0A917PWG5_9PSED|nr:zinc ABC transporter substrate-binding protein ZnuA [Pseudomonas matsuisoli]GGJ95166.1 zinc ABC transporter substrate-binding protein [Pseudomonas matsuisoli]
MFRPFVLLILLVFTITTHADVRLLTSIKPLQLMAAAVQDGVGEPDVLLPPGASPHHFALRPSDIRRLQEADLFYWVGPDMEGFLVKSMQDHRGESLAVQDLPGMTLRRFGEDGHGHAHTHDHDEHAHDHDHDHRPGSLDTHLWLHPANARVIAARMAEDLARLDPANAAKYRENAKAFSGRLDALDTRLKARLDVVSRKPFFVFHEAFDYFEAHYGLEHAGVFSVLGEVQPGARHVAEMRARLQQAGPSCVFSEPPIRPRLAETLTEGLPVKMAELDALGMTVDTDAHGYEQMLENLGNELAGCLEAL